MLFAVRIFFQRKITMERLEQIVYKKCMMTISMKTDTGVKTVKQSWPLGFIYQLTAVAPPVFSHPVTCLVNDRHKKV